MIKYRAKFDHSILCNVYNERLGYQNQPWVTARFFDADNAYDADMPKFVLEISWEPVPTEKLDDFMECSLCRQVPGCPTLCASCLHNRALISSLEHKVALAAKAHRQIADERDEAKTRLEAESMEHQARCQATYCFCTSRSHDCSLCARCGM